LIETLFQSGTSNRRMLESVRTRLFAGDSAGAREVLGKAVFELCHDHFVRGNRDHPLLSPSGIRLLDELRPLSARLLGVGGRGEYVADVLAEVRFRVDLKEGYAAAVLLVNHALELLLPEYSETVEQAIRDAKYSLAAGTREFGEDSPLGAFMPDIVRAAETMESEFMDKQLSRIETLDLSDLDAPENSLPGFPAIREIEGDEMVFECPSCSGTLRTRIDLAGEEFGCPCGNPVRTPIPSLVRMRAYRKAHWEAEVGVSRCRVCGAMIQIGRNELMRAGFCSPFCAKEGRKTFKEYVAKPGQREADDVIFNCECGTSLRAPLSGFGSRVPCKKCALSVWIPQAIQAEGRASIVSCRQCGHKIKSTARKCMFCGSPLSGNSQAP
jgi:hypothetical protein